MNSTLRNFDAQLLEEPEDATDKSSVEALEQMSENEESEGERMAERIWQKVLDTLGKKE